MEAILRNEKKTTKPNLDIKKKKNANFQNLFNYSEFSERQDDREDTGLILRWPGFIFSSARSPVNSGSAA